jgi:hypothetical protein
MCGGPWRSVMPFAGPPFLHRAEPLGASRAGDGPPEPRAYLTTRLFTTALTPEIPAATWVARARN